MKFIPYRLLRNRVGELCRLLAHEGQLVLTSNGEPFALMLEVSPDTLEETLLLAARLRAVQAVSAIRAEARTRGLDRLRPEEIEAGIAAARTGRKQA